MHARRRLRSAGGLLRVSSSRSRRRTSFSSPGSHKRALVIGAETFSRLLDWTDRTTCVLFGDGAGAIVLEARRATARSVARRHLQPIALGRPPSRQALCRRRPVDDQDGRPSAHGGQGSVPARGRHGDRRHQGLLSTTPASPPPTSTGSCRIRPTGASSTPRPTSSACAPEKVVVTVDRHGNTSAASIPLALDVAVKDGRIKKGDLVMIEAMGGGFTWGAALIRW